MTDPLNPYAMPLADLEKDAHVDPEDLVEEHDTQGPPREYVDPYSLERQLEY